MKTNQMTYRRAMAELKTIADRLRDGEDVDVDDLVLDVARAKELIDFCGAKVKKAETSIKEIVSELKIVGENTMPTRSPFAPGNNSEADEIPF